MSFYRETLENYLHTLNIATKTVYDVGGKELPVDKRVNSWAVDNYEILDLPEYDFNMNIVFEDEEADTIFCLELMEYIYNPVVCINNLARLLKYKGTLYITFPTLYPVHNPYKQDFLRYTKFGAMKLLDVYGFKIEEIVPRKIKDPLLYDRHVKKEGYKARGAMASNTLFDSGYIIRAKKI